MAASLHFLDPRRISDSRIRRWFPWKTEVERGSNEVSKTMPKRRPRVGIAFSSGGAKGLAHIGVIQVLEENGFEVAAVAGTSMGAYVGALWASGLNGKELEELAAHMGASRDRWKLVDPILPPRRGFIGGRKIEERLRDSLGNKTFADLKVPTFVVATELDGFHRHVFMKGDVASAILASIAVPGIVSPVCRDGMEFVDGGIASPLPTSALHDFADVDKVIAVSVMPRVNELFDGPTDETKKKSRCSWLKRPFRWLNNRLNIFAKGNMIDILRGAAMGSQIRLVERAADQADLHIRAINPTASWHDYHHYETYISLGRKAAKKALPELRQIFETEIEAKTSRRKEKAHG